MISNLKLQIKGKVTEARKIVDRAGAESRELTPEEQQAFDALMTSVDDLKRRVALLEAEDQQEQQQASENRSTRVSKPMAIGAYTGQGEGYSIGRALKTVLTRGRLEGPEYDVHQRMVSKVGQPSQSGSFHVPWNAKNPYQTRSLDTTTGGGALSEVTNDIFDLVREKSVVDRLGIRVISNLYGRQRFPVQDTSSSTYWIAEGSATTMSSPEIGYIELRPRTLSCGLVYTTRFLHESPENVVEDFIRRDLVGAMASALSKAVLVGAGGGAEEPQGIFNQSGLDTVTLSGGALTWSSVVQAEEKLLDAHSVIDESAVKWVASPTSNRLFKSISKGGSMPVFLYDEATKSLNGYPVEVSVYCPVDTGKHSVVLGDWSQCFIGSFGEGFQIKVDPYTRAEYNEVRVFAYHDLDIAFRNVGAWVSIPGIDPEA
jgi:HK97 family phage major capsid protein